MNFRPLREVFSHSQYTVLALAVASLVLLVTIWLPFHEFISYVFTAENSSILDKTKILWSSIGAFKTNFTFYTRVVAVTVAFFAGINISLIIYYFKKRIAVQKMAGTSFLGIAGGFIGVGCSACGSVILSSLFGIAATTSFIGVLPLKGAEFGILSILILLSSTYYILKKLQAPTACDVPSMKDK